jgi:hypothetical protein
MFWCTSMPYSQHTASTKGAISSKYALVKNEDTVSWTWMMALD